jgi:alpha-L-arabinofuranosidase
VDIQITDRQNVDKMAENVDKMAENVDKMAENVDKTAENFVIRHSDSVYSTDDCLSAKLGSTISTFLLPPICPSV